MSFCNWEFPFLNGGINFKNRIYLNTINKPKPTLGYYNFALNNYLNLFEKKVFKISLVDTLIDIDDLPKVEVDSTFLRVWKNKSKDPVLMINLHSKKYKLCVFICINWPRQQQTKVFKTVHRNAVVLTLFFCVSIQKIEESPFAYI